MIVGILALLASVGSPVSDDNPHFLGLMLIINGIVQGISLPIIISWLQLVSVFLSLIVGALILLNPQWDLRDVTRSLFVFLMVECISKAIFAFAIRPLPNWGFVLASGIIGILLALFLLASSDFLLASSGTPIWLLGVLLGILLIYEGVAIGYLAWRVRKS